MSDTIRSLLREIIDPLPQDVVVSTSAGIDSGSILLSALDVGKNVSVMSFTLDDRESKDFVSARRIAESFDLPFIPVRIPTDTEIVCDIVKRIVVELRTSKKTTIECLVPFFVALPLLKQQGHKTLITGSAADGHFGLSKKAMIHFRQPQPIFQSFRHSYFAKNDPAQTKSLPYIAKQYGISTYAPYTDRRIFNLWTDASWDDLNQPRQKEVVRREFPELDKLCLSRHVNLQLGDSGIAKVVGEIVRKEFTPQAKSPVSAYNELLRRTK
jgi:asparagine synthetase B (glutamine-hydrolysing)